MQASTARGVEKAASELEDWRILSGKRHRGSPNVHDAGPSSKVKREHRRKVKRSQYEPDWWQSHLDKRARVGFETLTSPSVADVAGPELPQAGDAVDDAVALALLPFPMKCSQTDFFRVAARARFVSLDTRQVTRG